MTQNFRVYCKRGVHPYDPIVQASNAKSAVKKEEENFSRMYGKKMHGASGCRQSGEECDLIALPTNKSHD